MPRPLPVFPLHPPVLLTAEVWNVIAGAADGDLADPDSVGNPAVRIPAVGSMVRYRPSLHASPVLHGPLLPQIDVCHVHAVDFQADETTHDIFADVTLAHYPPNPLPPPAAAPPHQSRFFSKKLSPSDVENRRVWVGKPGNRLFGSFRPKKKLLMRDIFGGVHELRRNAHTLIDQGWPALVHGKGLQERDRVYFIQMGTQRTWLVAFKKSFTPDDVAMTRRPPAYVHGLLNRLRDSELVRVRVYLGRSENILTQLGG